MSNYIETQENALCDGLLVHIFHVNAERGARRHFLAARLAFEVSRLLVVHKNLFIVKLAVTIVAKRLSLCSSFLFAHGWWLAAGRGDF